MSNISTIPPLISINWPLIKMGDLDHWEKLLYKVTEAFLVRIASKSEELALLNSMGVYHHIPLQFRATSMEHCRMTGEIPADWPTKGRFPGIWCSLFHVQNTFSTIVESCFLRILFKPGYFLFDSNNRLHNYLWNQWRSDEENMDQPNGWLSAKNSFNQSMADRMANPLRIFEQPLYPAMPNHLEFYRQYKFGAVVGRSDYMALVIILPESVVGVSEVSL